MTDEDAKIDKFFEAEFYKNSRPEKVYYVSEYWEKRAEKELAEPSVFTNLKAVNWNA